MSRWTSPQVAARRAERAAAETEARRRRTRRTWLLVGGVAVISVGLTVADYFWLKYRAQQRHLRQHPQHQNLGTRPAGTNLPPPEGK